MYFPTRRDIRHADTPPAPAPVHGEIGPSRPSQSGNVKTQKHATDSYDSKQCCKPLRGRTWTEREAHAAFFLSGVPVRSAAAFVFPSSSLPATAPPVSPSLARWVRWNFKLAEPQPTPQQPDARFTAETTAFCALLYKEDIQDLQEHFETRSNERKGKLLNDQPCLPQTETNQSQSFVVPPQQNVSLLTFLYFLEDVILVGAIERRTS